MTYNYVTFEKDGPLAVIALNRPAVFNAVNAALLEELVDALEGCGRDRAIRAIILTGAGEKAFCSGGDIGAMRESLAADSTSFFSETIPPLHAMIETIRGLSKPVVAAINGVAAGAGLNIALACDFRIAVETARFSAAYINIGLSGDGGGSFFLPRLVGLAKATELFLLGDTIDARQAESLGLLTRVVPNAELLPAAKELALKLAAKPSFAIGRMKALLNQSFNTDLTTQLESELQSITACGQTTDFREGVAAFTEKRPAQFEGR